MLCLFKNLLCFLECPEWVLISRNALVLGPYLAPAASFSESLDPKSMAKNGDKQFWKYKFHAANVKAQHALTHMSPFFFLLRVGWGKGEFFFGFFPLVPNVLPSSSLEVPQVLKLFLKAFLISCQFYPIWFAQSSTVMYIN